MKRVWPYQRRQQQSVWGAPAVALRNRCHDREERVDGVTFSLWPGRDQGLYCGRASVCVWWSPVICAEVGTSRGPTTRWCKQTGGLFTKKKKNSIELIGCDAQRACPHGFAPHRQKPQYFRIITWMNDDELFVSIHSPMIRISHCPQYLYVCLRIHLLITVC